MAEYMETEYIKKPILKIAIKSYFKNLKYQDKHTISVMDANADVNRIIGEIPAADVAPVKHGKWIHGGHEDGTTYCYCSECSEDALFDFDGYREFSKYCPWCGAKMDEQAGDTE